MESLKKKISLGPGTGRHPHHEVDPEKGVRLHFLDFKTIPQGLEYWANALPDQPAFYFLNLEEQLVERSFIQIYNNSQRVGEALRRRGIGSGDRVLIAFNTSAELLESFFGCHLVGAIPCLTERPFGLPAAAKSWEEKLRARFRVVRARAMISDEECKRTAQSALDDLGVSVLCPQDFPEETELRALPVADPAPLAFIQFTSGTTSAPKGVKISHQALMANIRCIGETGRFDMREVMVGWLPLHHDMGLVATTLSTFFHGRPTVLMPPMAFLFKPARWLWALHYFRGTASFAPNFAYQLCIKRVRDEDVVGLDLSSWSKAYNAAEFIYPETILNFVNKFGSKGFRSSSVVPAYGMAEMVVGVTCRNLDKPILMDTVSRSRLALENLAAPARENDPDSLTFVGVGPVFPQHESKIVDEAGQALGERRQGQILLRGPSLAEGYFENPEATSAAFRDGWLWTGDLGYKVGDELFICGRVKDLIIKAGENHHPYVMEHAAARVEGVREGCVAAFGTRNPSTGTEDLVVVFETREQDEGVRRLISKKVSDQVFITSGIRPDRVIPVAPNTVPKTSSGKVSRALLRDRLQASL